jgi:hypothetical protein
MTRAEFEQLWGPAPEWLDRFLQKTVRLPPDEDQAVGCLWWCGGQSRGGQRPGGSPYGSFSVNARLKGVRAHVAIATAGGLIQDFRLPEGMSIEHDCRRTLCVEIRHYDIIPMGENVKRRWAKPARELSEEQIETIRYRGVERHEYRRHPSK